MTFQGYLDTIKAKTGHDPAHFIAEAKAKNLSKHADLVSWLKDEYDLGTGHARALITLIQQGDTPRAAADDVVTKHFAGAKSSRRPTYDQLLAAVKGFGGDVSESPVSAYISWVRAGKKFAVVQVTAGRLDVGVKVKGAAPTERFQASGAWNAMVTHRVQILEPSDVDAELLTWLRSAYDQAG